MLYGEFIRELNKDCNGAILAYDSKLQQQGCMLYLGRGRTIFIPFQIIDSLKRELITLIQAKVLEGMTDRVPLSVVMDNGKLTLEVEP